ncbi:hypothetical protein CCHL11_08705 [Colletotrichum chlorophyti]|uniref:Uncharacterized protein n=1 Tax=Colletotrichum chlorophyti TaxID=708187 RepID=A0A1Q8RHC7_9PEZI|nr:hypothetical protein CCHL11_08705 [Colletotrichum chlorophyti]
MSSTRAFRLGSALRPSTFRSVQRVPRRYAHSEPVRNTKQYTGGSQPPPAASNETKVPTKPSEVNNRGTIFAIGGVTLVLAAFFMSLTGSPDRVAGVADATTRGGSGIGTISGPSFSGKSGAEKDLESTTGMDPDRSTGVAGLKSEQTNPHARKAKN